MSQLPIHVKNKLKRLVKMDTIILRAEAEDIGKRLDKFIVEACTTLSRTRIQNLIDQGMIELSPLRPTLASTKIKLADVIRINIPEAVDADPIAQDIPLDIIYEDEYLLVINKPVGLVVHPAPGHKDSTLVNALLAHCGDSLSGIGGVKRPGIVHRLDKDTSGLMVIAKNDLAHHALTAQFSDRSLSRTYQAFVWGIPSPSQGTISTLMGRDPHNRQKMAVVNKNGKEAITHYKVLKSFNTSDEARLAISLIECTLATGRTHQIRVHMRHLGHPLLGDSLYGNLPKNAKKTWNEELALVERQMLHAIFIKFTHPETQENLHFETLLAPDMTKLLKTIEKNKN